MSLRVTQERICLKSLRMIHIWFHMTTVKRRLYTCEMLLAWHKRKNFLHYIIISYEKLKNTKQPSGQTVTTVAKTNIFGKKSCWWNQLGVYYEMAQTKRNHF